MMQHSPMFTQVEGLVIDQNIKFSDLKGMLELFIHEISILMLELDLDRAFSLLQSRVQK